MKGLLFVERETKSVKSIWGQPFNVHVEKDPQVMAIMDNHVSDIWILDFGCCFHMCPIKSLFIGLQEDPGQVLLGDNHFCRIKGNGDIKLRMNSGIVRVFRVKLDTFLI